MKLQLQQQQQHEASHRYFTCKSLPAAYTDHGSRAHFCVSCAVSSCECEVSVQKAVLDRDASCCESGKLDACGKCDGSGKLVDVQNVYAPHLCLDPLSSSAALHMLHLLPCCFCKAVETKFCHCGSLSTFFGSPENLHCAEVCILLADDNQISQ